MELILFVRSEVAWEFIGWRTDVSVTAAGTVSERFLYERIFYTVQYRQCQFKVSYKTTSSTGCFSIEFNTSSVSARHLTKQLPLQGVSSIQFNTGSVNSRRFTKQLPLQGVSSSVAAASVQDISQNNFLYRVFLL